MKKDKPGTDLNQYYKDYPTGFCQIDRNFRIVKINEWMAEIIAIPVTKCLGKTFSELFPAITDTVESSFQKVIKTEEPILGKLIETEITSQPGFIRTFKWNYVPNHSGDSTLIGIICIVEDITETIDMPMVLKILAEKMGMGISVWDNDLRLITANNILEKMLGFTAGSLVPGIFMGDLFRVLAERGEYGEGDAEEQVRERIELAKRFESHSFERECLDGTVFEVRGAPMPGGGFVSTHLDITKRKQMEMTILESEKLKLLGTITAGVAHEFNNLLAVILGSAELLDADSKGDPELKKGLSTIVKASDDGAEIVKGLLSYVKSQEKDISDFIFFDISHLLKEAIDFVKPRWKNMAQGKGIDYKIEREGMREVPEVLCNTTELREVFTNIINNALDAMPDGGRLSFSTSSNEDTVFIRISDTGIGMSGDVKKNIFDPFFTTRRPQGTGLGLSISYGVIMRHGGKIEVESEEGKGTTFNLSLPIRRDIVQKIVPPEPDRRAAVRKLRILVVDDNEDVCEIMYGVLARGGHDVKTVDDGVEAIALAGKEKYDLVLCDLLMPKIHGYEVIKAIMKLDKIPKIGIMTGWNEKLKPIGEDFKVDFILKKPFKHAELAKHINELFG
ncbi:MAG: response regulator [Candidatus Scalindua sp.]|nr:response regulator [Candidatus Scalindua sp.]